MREALRTIKIAFLPKCGLPRALQLTLLACSADTWLSLARADSPADGGHGRQPTWLPSLTPVRARGCLLTPGSEQPLRRDLERDQTLAGFGSADIPRPEGPLQVPGRQGEAGDPRRRLGKANPTFARQGKAALTPGAKHDRSAELTGTSEGQL